MAMGHASSGARGSNSCTKVAIATIVVFSLHSDHGLQATRPTAQGFHYDRRPTSLPKLAFYGLWDGHGESFVVPRATTGVAGVAAW